MRNKAIILTLILLILSVGNFIIFVPEMSIRNVDILTIGAIGFLGGVLLTLLLNNKIK